MTRFIALLRADVRFQFRYGFYFLYLFFTVLYVALVHVLPEGARRIARDLTVFTDPAALGLFFMGAIVLFEKGERVHSSLAVSPASAAEYALSKAVSLSLISVLSGAVIIAGSLGSLSGWTVAGLALSSALFSCAGLFVGTRAPSLNGYLILSVPFEIVLFIPALLWYFGIGGVWMVLHPGAAALALISGGGSHSAGFKTLACASLSLWLCAAFAVTVPAVERMLAGREESPL